MRSSSLLFVLAAPLTMVAAPGAKLDFEKDVRPLLAQKCFACHGDEVQQSWLICGDIGGHHNLQWAGNRRRPKRRVKIDRITADRLTGGLGTLGSGKALKTLASYWP